MFLLCKRGRKSDRWFSCRMACVCWSGLLAVQTHFGCFLFLFFFLASRLFAALSLDLCVCVCTCICTGMYTQTKTRAIGNPSVSKNSKQKSWKRIGPAPKFSEPEMKKIKRRPTAEPPQSIQVPVSCSSLRFLCSCSRFNVLISLWHKKRKKRKEVEALEHLAGEFQTNI